MFNGETDLAKFIKGVEGELLALQTAYQRPLGALDFYKESASIPLTLEESYGVYYVEVTIEVKVEASSIPPPIVQLGYDVPAGFITVIFDGVSTDEGFTTWTYKLALMSLTTSTATLKIGVTSSQTITSLTWSVT